MKRSIIAIANALLLSLMLLLPSAVAAGTCRPDNTCDDPTASVSCTTDADCPTSAPVAAPVGVPAVSVPQPLGNVNLAQAIGNTIRVILGFTGSMALVMFIYGGFLYMTAAGAEDRVTKGKNTLIWAILGLIAVFSAYSVVNFIIKGLDTPPPAASIVEPGDK